MDNDESDATKQKAQSNDDKLNVDEIDCLIVEFLQSDAEQSGLDISKGLQARGHKKSINAVNERIKKLTDNGFIKKSLRVDYKKFGAPNIFFLRGKIRATTDFDLAQFVEMAVRNPRVYEVYELAGNIDYLIKVRTETLGEATGIAKQLSRKTGVEVKTMSVAEVFKDDIAIPAEILHINNKS